MNNKVEYWNLYFEVVDKLREWINKNKDNWKYISDNGTKEDKILLGIQIEKEANEILNPLSNGKHIGFASEYIEKVLNEEI